MERFSYAALYHSGTRGMHWGQRNYQNKDGTWTELGKERRRIGRLERKSVQGSYGIDYRKISSAQLGSKERRQIEAEQQYIADNFVKKYDAMEGRIQQTTYSQVPSQLALSVAKQCGINVKTRQTNMYEDRAAVNPNFTGENDGYSSNCFGCSLAYILRRKGLDVNAGDIPDGADYEFRKECIENYDQVNKHVNLDKLYWDDDNFNESTKGHKLSHTELLERTIYEDGCASDPYSPHYGTIGINRPSGSGHAMAWEYDPNSGRIIFIESQSNRVSPTYQFERIGNGFTNPVVTYTVDPQINMSAFSKFGTNASGEDNNTFRDKQKSMEIVSDRNVIKALNDRNSDRLKRQYGIVDSDELFERYANEWKQEHNTKKLPDDVYDEIDERVESEYEDSWDRARENGLTPEMLRSVYSPKSAASIVDYGSISYDMNTNNQLGKRTKHDNYGRNNSIRKYRW